jgi:hypothetical protein
MNKGIIILGLALVCLAPQLVLAGTIDQDYDQAIGHYFKITSAQVSELRAAGVVTEDLAVCCHIAKHSGARVASIAEMRVRGDSWSEIVLGRNMGMNIFYQPIVGYSSSETYYPIFAKFDAVPASQWRKLALSDEEITNLVNLRFISSEHDYSVYKVMAQRDEGLPFLDINKNIKEAKQVLLAEQKRERRETVNAGF